MLRFFDSRRNASGHFTFTPSPHLTADTRAIGGNAVLTFVGAAERLGYPRALILEGLRFDLAELRDRRARVSWRELVRLIENGERAGMTLAELELAGELAAESPHLVLKPLVHFFLRPEHLLYVGLRWIGPGTFPVFDLELAHEARDLRLSLELPPQLPGCAAYFHICTGTLAAVPTGIGQPKARVTATISARRGVFDIRCAPFERGAVRMGRIARALFSVPRVIEALAGQEQAIREGLDAALDAESRFLRILGALPDGVAIVRDDQILFANAALAHALGFERASELVGVAWSRFHAGAGGGECRHLGPGGKEAVLELSPRQSIAHQGAPAELVLAHDVTEKRQLDKRLAVADRMASLATVAASLAHEINNPLAMVINNLELCARRPDDAREFLSAANEGAKRVRDIVRELRVFSQPETEDQVLVDLREVVESSVALARGKVRARASLCTSLEPVGLVAGSRGKLSQVLLNLIINALEALPRERPTGENRIEVRLTQRNGCARIEVEDNGVGIATEAQPHLFEPFFTTRRDAGGSGLGLAVAHDIVTKAGGTIGFTSTPGLGTRFVIELPLCRPADHASASGEAEPAPDSLRILIADDEPSLVRTLAAALSQDRHRVVSAASGLEAIDQIEHNGEFDLILCDLMMPNGSGADVYAHVRATRPELAGRIVFMTGGTFRADARDFLASVENPCLDKPFRLEELSRLIVSARNGGWKLPVVV